MSRMNNSTKRDAARIAAHKKAMVEVLKTMNAEAAEEVMPFEEWEANVYDTINDLVVKYSERLIAKLKNAEAPAPAEEKIPVVEAPKPAKKSTPKKAEPKPTKKETKAEDEFDWDDDEAVQKLIDESARKLPSKKKPVEEDDDLLFDLDDDDDIDIEPEPETFKKAEKKTEKKPARTQADEEWDREFIFGLDENGEEIEMEPAPKKKKAESKKADAKKAVEDDDDEEEDIIFME